MIPLSIDPGEGGLRVLCLGAHADDLEIGAGGTMLDLLASHYDVNVRWVVLSGDDARRAEARQAAETLLEGAASADLSLLQYRDGFFPAQWAALKEEIERLKPWAPHVVFTHRPDDLHQDHRVVSDLTWTVFRDQLVLAYEIPKYDGDLTPPNLFVPLDAAQVDRKIELLLDTFESQRSRPWFTEETFRGLMRLRGVECAAPSGYAEGFHARKLVLAPGGRA